VARAVFPPVPLARVSLHGRSSLHRHDVSRRRKGDSKKRRRPGFLVLSGPVSYIIQMRAPLKARKRGLLGSAREIAVSPGTSRSWGNYGRRVRTSSRPTPVVTLMQTAAEFASWHRPGSASSQVALLQGLGKRRSSVDAKSALSESHGGGRLGRGQRESESHLHGVGRPHGVRHWHRPLSVVTELRNACAERAIAKTPRIREKYAHPGHARPRDERAARATRWLSASLHLSSIPLPGRRLKANPRRVCNLVTGGGG
jgi:hypothetical protein